jgi:hypothetical protein
MPDASEEIIASDQLNIPTLGSSPVCQKCDRPLTGKSARALGGTFHLECFKCEVRDALKYTSPPMSPLPFPFHTPGLFDD